MIDIFVNIILIVIFPFIFVGLIKRTKSFWAGKKGPSIFQFLFDFIKLLKKDRVVSSTTSFIFQISPIISFAAILLSACFVPIFNHKAIFSFDGDFLFFAYLLALSKAFLIIMSMDTGSSFEGMGASRELTFSTLVEPGLFIIISSIVYGTGYKSFGDIFDAVWQFGGWTPMIVILSAIALFIIMLVEGSRLPVDDPATHLELTMIHEVIILDNSGPDLGLILYGSYIKFFLFSSLIANLIIPLNFFNSFNIFFSLG